MTGQVNNRPVVQVRAAEAGDMRAVVALVERFITTTRYQRYLELNRPALRRLVAFLIARGPFFVAELGEDLVGFITGAAGEEPIGATKMLDELAWWVEPEYRNGRTGPKLLRAYEAWARANGVEAMTMKAPIDQPQVAEFYQRVGYEAVEVVFFKRVE